MITCAACDRQVIPTKPFSWLWFLAWFILGGIGGFFYLLYYATRQTAQCPLCYKDIYGRAQLMPWEEPTPAPSSAP